MARDPANLDAFKTSFSLNWKVGEEPPIISLNFLLHEPEKDWRHSMGEGNRVIVLSPSAANFTKVIAKSMAGLPTSEIVSVVDEILQFEVYANKMTLMHRYHKAREILQSDRLDFTNREHVAFLYTWLRYSFTKQLTWQKNYNTQPRQLQESCVQLTNTIASVYKI